MTKISDLVLSDPIIKSYDFKIAIFASLCALASLATKSFLTFSGGSDAIYTIAAGYFAIGGNLILLAPKFIKNPIKNLTSKVIPFLGHKSNFAFILKTLGAVGFFVAGIIEGQPGLAIGGAGFAAGNIIALIKGYKAYSVAGYGLAAGAFLTAGFINLNDMLIFAGASAILEMTFLAIYKHFDENRFEVMKERWEEKKKELEQDEVEKEELEKIQKRFQRNAFSAAFGTELFKVRTEKYFDSEFAKYAHKEKEIIEDNGS